MSIYSSVQRHIDMFIGRWRDLYSGAIDRLQHYGLGENLGMAEKAIYNVSVYYFYTFILSLHTLSTKIRKILSIRAVHYFEAYTDIVSNNTWLNNIITECICPSDGSTANILISRYSADYDHSRIMYFIGDGKSKLIGEFEENEKMWFDIDLNRYNDIREYMPIEIISDKYNMYLGMMNYYDDPDCIIDFAAKLMAVEFGIRYVSKTESITEEYKSVFHDAFIMWYHELINRYGVTDKKSIKYILNAYGTVYDTDKEIASIMDKVSEDEAFRKDVEYVTGYLSILLDD